MTQPPQQPPFGPGAAAGGPYDSNAPQPPHPSQPPYSQYPAPPHGPVGPPPTVPPYGQYPGGQPFPPPKKSNKGWIIAVAVIGALVVLGGVARLGTNAVAERQSTAFGVGDCLEVSVPSGSVPLSELDSVPAQRDCADDRAIYAVAKTGDDPTECGVFDSVISRDGKALCLMANFHEGSCYAVSEVGVEIATASCAQTVGASGADMVIRWSTGSTIRAVIPPARRPWRR